MSLLSEALATSSGVVNDLLGDVCVYTRKSDGSTTDDVMVIITRGKIVTDEFKNVIGYRDEANFTKSQIPFKPQQYDIITEANGNEWRVGEITKETSSKWYVDVLGV